MRFDRVPQRIAVAVLAILALTPATLLANGRLEGTVTGPGQKGLGGVAVLITETAASTFTDAEGRFAFDDVRSGTVTVVFTVGTYKLTVSDVRIEDNTVQLDRSVDWLPSPAEALVVEAASLRDERLPEAPTSIALVDQATIARAAPMGEVPRALDSVAGLQVTQSGYFDFNVNMRGFNTAISRRVLTLLDGRDASSILVGAQEWSAVALPVDEIARIEVVRGPASSLYGANAFNGVIDMTAKAPRDNPGGNAQFSFGERDTARASIRQAGKLAADWSYRAHAAYLRTDDFFTARTTSVEYPGLPTEAVAPATDRTESMSVGLRLDRELSAGRRFTVEGGWARPDGNVLLTGAGRVQNRGVQRPWVRSAFQTSHWSASGFYDGRIGR